MKCDCVINNGLLMLRARNCTSEHDHEDTNITDKRYLYRTAIAAISCARVKAGDVVAIHCEGLHDGVYWYAITATSRGPIDPVMYPETHLEQFVL